MSKENRENRDNETHAGLMSLAAALPEEVAPERDLWPGIEQAISQPARPRRSAWNSVWAQAAAVVVLVGGSSGITYLAVKDDGFRDIPSATGAADVFGDLEPVSGAFGGRYTLGNDYLDARTQLEGSLKQKIGMLTPEARAAVVENLQTIRLAIKDLNNALAKEPDNVLLQELLLSTYHEEMALMRRVDGIANSAMRRDDI